MANAQQTSPAFSPSHGVGSEDLYAWRQRAIAQAHASGIAPAEVDWLLRELLHLDQLSLRLVCNPSPETISVPVSLDDLTTLWQRRLQARIPLQYLTGVAPWRKFVLQVSPAVLIPRPETELIVNLAAQLTTGSDSNSAGLWADLGTGSGAIALGLAEILPNVHVHAVDVSPEALAIAQANANQLKFAHAITFHQGYWWSPLESLRGKFQGMVSNPPYIPSKLIPALQVEVAEHEPHLALDGGTDGLEAVRVLVQQSPDYLVSGGLWLVEIMMDQAEAVIALLNADGRYDQVQVHQDWSGIDRFVSACLISSHGLG